MHDPIYAKKTVIIQKQGVEDCPLTIEFAIQYTESDSVFQLSFANGVETLQGGTHLETLKSTVSSFVEARKRDFGQTSEWSSDVVLGGFVGAIRIEYPRVAYGGATRKEVANTEIEDGIFNVVRDEMNSFANEKPEGMQNILDHCLRLQQANDARRYGDFPTLPEN